jgi:hypothetical protein
MVIKITRMRATRIGTITLEGDERLRHSR